MFIDLVEREEGKERGERQRGWTERGRERNIDQSPPIHTQTGDGTCNLGMGPDQGSKPQHFGIWGNAPTNWATRPGLMIFFFNLRNTSCILYFEVYGARSMQSKIVGICLFNVKDSLTRYHSFFHSFRWNIVDILLILKIQRQTCFIKLHQV